MALVDYTSSDEDEDEPESASPSIKPSTQSTSLKRKYGEELSSNLPPLPTKFYDLYASTARVSTTDDPSLHGGRKRVKPHVEGNWPTHLYIEWYPSTTEYNALHKVVSNLKTRTFSQDVNEIHSFLTSDLGAPLPLHISLSRPIGFSTTQKDDFANSLKQTVKHSGIRPFNVSFTGLDWVANFEKTRWFLVLRTKNPESDALNKLLHVCNKVVQEYGQPPLYVDPSETQGGGKYSPESSRNRKGKIRSRSQSNQPVWNWSSMSDASDAYHISIAWALSNPSEELLEATKSQIMTDFVSIKQIEVKVEEIKSKVGNIVTSIPLRESVLEGRGLFGL